MKLSFRVKTTCAAVMVVLTGWQDDVSAQPVSEEEITADGLHRVDPSILPSAWLLPEADLSRYTHAFVMPTVMLFRDMPPPSRSAWADSNRTAFPVEDKMKQRLRETFGESFHEAMSVSPNYEISDELGRNVVLVRAYLTDVATGLPPERPGANVDSVRWLWEGNLILELRDSMSDEILLRILSRQRVDGPVEAERMWSLAPDVTRRWSRWIVEQLSILYDFYPSRLYRLHERAQGSID